jgi:hypothetical protein
MSLLSSKIGLNPRAVAETAQCFMVVLAAMLASMGIAMAQQPSSLTAQPSLQSPAADATAPAAPAAKAFSQEALEQILAPIALYPDNLLAQVLMASTYPLEVVQAARWAKDNPGVKDKALEDAMAKQPWDPSVKSLTAVPQVLQQMNDNLGWLQKLGDAFLAQREDVMGTVQTLRGRAAAKGNLKTSPEQVVKTETVETKTVYIIESPQPEVIYVPTYNPTVVYYDTWPYPAPPYYVYPPAYVYPPGLAFATGVIVGAAIWGNCNWGYNNVYVNVNHYNQFNRANINNGNWNHNVAHRGGVAYGDRAVADKYSRGNQRAQSRESFRGFDQGTAADRGSRPSAGTSDVRSSRPGGGASASTRDVKGGRDSGGFGGVDSGSQTRAASSRGNSSFGGSRGGRSGGGRRR